MFHCVSILIVNFLFLLSLFSSREADGMFGFLVMNFAYPRLSVKIGGSWNGSAAQPFLRGFRAAPGQHGTFHESFHRLIG